MRLSKAGIKKRIYSIKSKCVKHETLLREITSHSLRVVYYDLVQKRSKNIL